MSEYVDGRNKVSICYSCKTIRISDKKSLECKDCGYFPKAVWNTPNDFATFVKRRGLEGLKGFKVDSGCKQILIKAKILKEKGV